jgi:anti-sigma-K factor RskA
MMAFSEDHIALAAEYILGTLDAEERGQAEAIMLADKDFAAMVETWERRFGALNEMVGAVEPPQQVWEKIKAAIADAEPQASLPPEPQEIAQPAPVLRPEAAPEIRDGGNIIVFTQQLKRWRNLASGAMALAAALLALIVLQAWRPELLPGALRPEVRTQVALEKPAAPSTSAAAPQYVAVLQKDGGAPAFILTVDGATRNFTVRKVGAGPEPGKSFELWLISDKLPRPRSLGVIGGTEFTARPALAAYDPEVVTNATYAVTVEQAGGSPDGLPHSAPVFSGKLIEAVPSTSR